jgi:hypothetical protein
MVWLAGRPGDECLVGGSSEAIMRQRDEGFFPRFRPSRVSRGVGARRKRVHKTSVSANCATTRLRCQQKVSARTSCQQGVRLFGSLPLVSAASPPTGSAGCLQLTFRVHAFAHARQVGPGGVQWGVELAVSPHTVAYRRSHATGVISHEENGPGGGATQQVAPERRNEGQRLRFLSP